MVNCLKCTGYDHVNGQRLGYSSITSSNMSSCTNSYDIHGYHPYDGPKFHISYLMYWRNSGGLIHSSYCNYEEEMVTERVCTTNNTAKTAVFCISNNYHLISQCFILEKITSVYYTKESTNYRVRFVDCSFGVMPANNVAAEVTRCNQIDSIPDEVALFNSMCYLVNESFFFTPMKGISSLPLMLTLLFLFKQ